jgi:hypothetical protein
MNWALISLTKMITNERIVNTINMGGTARERPFKTRMFARFLIYYKGENLNGKRKFTDR